MKTAAETTHQRIISPGDAGERGELTATSLHEVELLPRIERAMGAMRE